MEVIERESLIIPTRSSKVNIQWPAQMDHTRLVLLRLGWNDSFSGGCSRSNTRTISGIRVSMKRKDV